MTQHTLPNPRTGLGLCVGQPMVTESVTGVDNTGAFRVFASVAFSLCRR